MKAAVVHDFNQALRIEDVPVPSPGPGEVLVKIETSGLCHTDIRTNCTPPAGPRSSGRHGLSNR